MKKNLFLSFYCFVSATMLLASPKDKSSTSSNENISTYKAFNKVRALVIPSSNQKYGPDILKKNWNFNSKNKGYFTFTNELDDVRALPGNILQFKLKKSDSSLGWGNYNNRLSSGKRFKLWDKFTVKFKVKQSKSIPTKWNIRLWSEGFRDEAPTKPRYAKKKIAKFYKAETQGTDWQLVEFENIRRTPGHGAPSGAADGFDLTIKGEPGNTIEMKDFEIIRDVYKGYFRKEFVIPDKAIIWGALADIGNQGELYINGREIPCDKSVKHRPVGKGEAMYQQESVNLKPYLRPGRNCIGIYGHRLGHPPYITFNSTIILVSGEKIKINTDASWKWNTTHQKNWSTPGFNDSSWKTFSLKKKVNNKTKEAIISQRLGLNYKLKTDLPAPFGYMWINTPDDNQYFFVDNKNVVFNVKIPTGLKKKKPYIKWTVSNYIKSKIVNINSSKTSKYSLLKNTMLYRIDCGKLKRGVYLLKAQLIASDGKILDDRLPEPFVVVGKIPMNETLGNTYNEGLDIELENVIDYIDPDNSKQPWMEVDGKNIPGRNKPWKTKYVKTYNTPVIVQKNGLKYRETRSNYGAQISHLIQFKHPGDWYLMELEFPNDRRRLMGVSCSSQYDFMELNRCCSKCGPTIWTGDKYPLTGKMKKMKWLYRPEAGNHAINLISLTECVPAAASKLKIYHIKGNLPALKAPQTNTRWLGVLTERTWPDNGFAKTFQVNYEKRPKNLKDLFKTDLAKRGNKPIIQICNQLEEWLDTCEHYVQYLRFTGQNFHAMGCYQYSDANTPFIPLDNSGIQRLIPDIRDILARVLMANNIDFVASVEFACNSSVVSNGNSSTTPYLIDNKGTIMSYWNGRYGFNFNHPEVREVMYKIADNLVDKFKGLPNFKGINWSAYFGGDWQPSYRSTFHNNKNMGVFDAGYGDATISQFEKDTQIKLPVSYKDPARFEKRYALLTSPRLKSRWVDWRAKKLKDFFSGIYNRIHKKRADLKVIASLMFYPEHAVEFQKSGLPLHDFLKQWGWDSKRFAEDENIILTHWMHATLNYWPSENKPNYPYGWLVNESPEFYKVFDSKKDRAVMLMHHWIEAERFGALFPKKLNWPRPYQSTMMGQNSGDNAGEVFAQALIGADPDIVMFGFTDASLFVGDEQPMRRFAQALRYLPSEKFNIVGKTGLKSNFAIRELRKDGKFWFYVVNPGYWNVEGSVTIEGSNKIINPVTGKNVAKAGTLNSETIVSIKLKPYSFSVFTANTDKIKIKSWKTYVRTEELEHMKNIIDKTSTMLKNRRISIVLTPKDLKFMNDSVSIARKALAKQEYAKAWHTMTNPRFWILLNDYMAKIAKYATEKKKLKTTKTKRKLEAVKVFSPPVIDGKLDDAVWRKAKVSSCFMDKDAKPAFVGTDIYALYDEKNIYFAFVCRDRYPNKVKKSATSEMEINKNRDDQIAFFIQPEKSEKKNYYQMGFNPGGCKFDQSITGGEKDYNYSPQWEVRSSTTKDGWIAEVKIPFDIYKTKICTGKSWGINFHRRFRNDEVQPSHWSYTPGVWHDTKNFGNLEFK